MKMKKSKFIGANLLDGQIKRLQGCKMCESIKNLEVARAESFNFKLKTSLRNRTIGMESEGLSTSYRRSTSHLDLLELEAHSNSFD